MKQIKDCFGTIARLTDERLTHILEHPEMQGFQAEIDAALQKPQFVRRSRTDDTVRLYYEFYTKTAIGGKWICVVVKYLEKDASVITAYLTDQPKAGEDLWPTK